MTVEIGPITAVRGSVALITSFSDTFNRTSGKLGRNWGVNDAYIATPPNANYSLVEIRIGASSFDAGQCLIGNFQGTGTVIQYGGGLVALPIYLNLYDNGGIGDTQFSQGTFLSTTAGPGSGVSCCHLADQETYYAIQAISASVSLIRMNNGAATVLGTVKAGAPVGNEVYKLAIQRHGGGNVDFQCYINPPSAATLTGTDSSASRLLVGSPGMISRASQAASVTEWRNFVGGVGT